MAASRVPGQPFLVFKPAIERRSAGTPRSLVERLSEALKSDDNVHLAAGLEEVAHFAESGLTPEIERVMVKVADRGELPAALRASAMIAIASAAEHEGDIRTAIDWVSRAADTDPHPSTVARLVTLAALSGDTESARRQVNDGLQRWDSDVDLLTSAASLLLNSGEAEAGRELAERAMALAADHAGVLALSARLLLLDGNLPAAEESARRLTALRPSLGRAMLALVLDGQARLAEDRGIIEAVLADLPNDIWVEMSIAALLSRLDRDDEASKIYDRVLMRNPADPNALRERGALAARQGNFDLASQDLDLAASLAPDDQWITLMRGEIARARGDGLAAVELLTSIDAQALPDWAAVSLGGVYFELGQLDDARATYESLLQRDPDNLPALLGLIDVELGAVGDTFEASAYSRAEELLERVLFIDPDHPTSHALYGELLRRRGSTDEALDHFDSALAIHPDWSYALASKGQVLLAMGDDEAGLRLLERAVVNEPLTAWVVDELARNLRSLDPANSERRMRKVQKKIRDRGSDGSLVLGRRIDWAVADKRFADADRLYREARGPSPSDPELIIGHVQVLRALGRNEEALAMLDAETVGHDGDSLTWERINLLWDLDRLDEVRSELERLTEHADAQPSAAVLAAMGELNRLQGNYVTARELLERSLAAVPENSYAVGSLGVLEAQVGDEEIARSQLEHAARLGSDFALFHLVNLYSVTGNRDGLLALAEPAERPRLDAGTTRIRVLALRELGADQRAIELLDEHLAEVGSSPELVMLKAYSEIELGMQRRATATLLSIAESVPASSITELVGALIRVDRWHEARDVIARADPSAAQATELARADLQSAAGEWESAAAVLRSATDRKTAVGNDVWVRNATCLRLLNRTAESVEAARQAYRLNPTDPWLRSELAESLLADGNEDEARVHFDVVINQMQRRVHCGSDQLNLEGWCLLRTQRSTEAIELFLRALSTTDQVSIVLYNLILATLCSGELAQADVLLHRADEELRRLSVPIRRGVLGRVSFDFNSTLKKLDSAAAEMANRLLARQQVMFDQLSSEFEQLRSTTSNA